MKKNLLVFIVALISCNKKNDEISRNSPVNLPSVKIGNQIWTTQNLDVERYRNGDLIQQITDPNVWNIMDAGAWCYFNNDPSTNSKFGKLYNWYAINDPRGLAPEGWHIPTKEEYDVLVNYLGGTPLAGGQLKGLESWILPNNGATNTTGFNALSNGARLDQGLFQEKGKNGFWYTSSLFSSGRTYAFRLINTESSASGIFFETKKYGCSVRLVKD